MQEKRKPWPAPNPAGKYLTTAWGYTDRKEKNTNGDWLSFNSLILQKGNLSDKKEEKPDRINEARRKVKGILNLYK